MRRLLVVFVLVGALPAPIMAAPRRHASREPKSTKVDADFSLQGEYLGQIRMNRGTRYFGLQVVALGAGEFDAVAFPGGLPGAGALREEQEKLTGARSKEVIKLSGADHSIVVHAGYAIVSDKNGHRLGEIRKVERSSPTMGARPLNQAIVLFDGRDDARFDKVQKTPEGWLLAGATTTMSVQDFCLHLEFRTPYMPEARGQARGNSGVYIQRRYEVQILDSFGLEGAANECGGLYKLQPPDVNMCLPPLAWQTYDIYFTAARWNATGTKKLSPAILTVLHNGVPIHARRRVLAKTGSGQEEAPEPLPIYLQDHGNPVTFRNVWIVMNDQHHGQRPPSTSSARYVGPLRRMLHRIRR